MVIEHATYVQKLDYYFDVNDVFMLYIPVAILAMVYGFFGTILV
jgi:hypothetical protein